MMFTTTNHCAPALLCKYIFIGFHSYLLLLCLVLGSCCLFDSCSSFPGSCLTSAFVCWMVNDNVVDSLVLSQGR